MKTSFIAASLMALGLTIGAVAAEAKTRVHIGIGVGHPYYDCVNPGYVDFCGLGIYRGGFYRDFHSPYYNPRYRFFNEPRYRRGHGCSDAARAIRSAGYRNVKATDCVGRHLGFSATKRGKVYKLRVDSVTGRIAVRR